MSDKVTLFSEDGDEIEFKVLADTTINGETYLLVAGEEEEGGETPAYIMRMIPSEDTEEIALEIVDNEKEMLAISRVFEEILDEVNIISE